MTKKINNVPLLCSLCPNNPRFSDISHLLTHISSKSHLSHRFKLQIRCQAEPSARQQLDDFETWYAEHGIGDMLSERLTAKEQKTTAKGARNAVVTVKKDVKDTKPRTGSKSKNTSAVLSTPKLRAPVPRMHDSEVSLPAPVKASRSENYNPYTTPSAKRKLPNFDDDSISRRTRGALARRETPAKEPLAVVEIPDESNCSEIIEKVSDATRLKGVKWPGMALWDSATDDMKRNRNQKKHASVLENMILSSVSVEPNEWIFDADIEVTKVRSMYDPEDHSSPFMSEGGSPAPPRRRRQRRLKVDADDSSSFIDHNEVDSSPLRPRKRQGSTNIGSISNKILSDPFGSYDEQSYEPVVEDDDFRLVMESISGEKSFGIFRDISPGRTESPLLETKFDAPTDGGLHLPLQPTSTNRTVQNAPVEFDGLLKPGFASPSEKNSQQDNQRRTPAVANSFPPQAFHDHAYNPLLFSTHAHTFAFGDRHTGYHDENAMSFAAFDERFKPMLNQGSTGHHHLAVAEPDAFSPVAASPLRFRM